MLNQKNAVITGGGRGIGAAIAEKFASLGANVAIIYHGREESAAARASAFSFTHFARRTRSSSDR